MAACLEPLRDDRVDPMRLEPARLVDSRCRRQDLRTPTATFDSNSAEGKPK